MDQEQQYQDLRGFLLYLHERLDQIEDKLDRLLK